MQRVLSFRHMAEAAKYMHREVFDYINEGQIESFESFEQFDLMAFDWYDVHSERTEDSKILIYFDREDLFFFCEDEAAERKVHAITDELAHGEAMSNEALLYRFFVKLLKGDMAYLDAFESAVNDGEERILHGDHEDSLGQILQWRKELLRLKQYYDQLDSIFDEISANDNELLGRDVQRRMVILGSRTDRYLAQIHNLKDIVSQLREAYQSQLSIQQNDLMKLFTVVTVIFLPLTLIAGWYGMNFRYMPELGWSLGYPGVAALSAAIAGGLIWLFRKRKWL